MLELELLLLSYPPSLQKGEHLPRFPVKRIPREDPMRSGERLNIGTDQVTEPTGTSGTSRAQAEDTEGFGHRQMASERDKLGEATNHLPVFHGVRMLIMGRLSFLGPRGPIR